MNIQFFKAVGWISLAIIAGLWMCSCAPKPDNEISEMADRCFRNKQSIRIEFTPHPMDKNTLESEK